MSGSSNINPKNQSSENPYEKNGRPETGTPQSSPAKTPRPKGKRRRRKLSRQGWIAIAALAAIVLLIISLVLFQNGRSQKLSLTYLDEIKQSDLYAMPPESFEDKIEVKDYTIYGTSLVFYDRDYEALETDGFYGRNAMLKNIQDGSTITTAFAGGADSGFDLQSIPEGVYEIYLSDGYTPKRAYLSQTMTEEPFVTIRDGDTVKKIQISASPSYLDKFGLYTDQPYLYLSVTESEPVVRVADVVIDPSGLTLNQFGVQNPDWAIEGFDENQTSQSLADKIKVYLENAGLKVIFSHQPGKWASYLGEGSRVAAGYEAEAKIFLALGMDSQDYPRPYLISSPFTNGRLGNQIAADLNAEGIELQNMSSLPQLNAGNSYDLLLADENLQNSPFSASVQIRETGGKATSAGQMEGWSENAQFAGNTGMEAVLFCYASTENAQSRTYFVEHEEQITKGIAQGILDYAHIQKRAELPPTTESEGSENPSETGVPASQNTEQPQNSEVPVSDQPAPNPQASPEEGVPEQPAGE